MLLYLCIRFFFFSFLYLGLCIQWYSHTETRIHKHKRSIVRICTHRHTHTDIYTNIHIHKLSFSLTVTIERGNEGSYTACVYMLRARAVCTRTHTVYSLNHKILQLQDKKEHRKFLNHFGKLTAEITGQIRAKMTFPFSILLSRPVILLWRLYARSLHRYPSPVEKYRHVISTAPSTLQGWELNARIRQCYGPIT